MEKGLSRPALEVDSTASPPITSTTICTNDGSSPSVDAQDLPRSESIRDETSTCHDSGAAVRMKSDKMPVEASDLESVAPLVRGTEDTLHAGKTVLSSPVRTTSKFYFLYICWQPVYLSVPQATNEVRDNLRAQNLARGVLFLSVLRPLMAAMPQSILSRPLAFCKTTLQAKALRKVYLWSSVCLLLWPSAEMVMNRQGRLTSETRLPRARVRIALWNLQFHTLLQVRAVTQSWQKSRKVRSVRFLRRRRNSRSTSRRFRSG